MIDTRFITAKEVADLLKLNLVTVYEFIRTGELKALHFGRNYRISEHDLKAFLDAHQVHTDNTNLQPEGAL